MSNCFACIDAGTSRAIYARERWDAQQETLADSINDTARMVRASLVLVLLAALYLFLILLVGLNDERLLRETPVLVPQINIEASIKTSYIVGPPIFLYLHVQTLFLLSILARKIRRFTEASYNSTISLTDWGIPRQSNAEEHWNLLSAFAFVQLFQPIGDHLRSSLVRKLLSLILFGISIAVIPVLLLLLIDLSFVKYQSINITNFHHLFLVFDIMSITWFTMYNIWLCREEIFQTPHIKVMIGMIGGCILLFCVFFAFYVQPVKFDGPLSENDRVGIWKKGEYNRYIDVNNKPLTNTEIELPYDTGTKRIHTERLDLAERELRYACFRSAKLYHVDLRFADLRGADFGYAEIHNSDLSQAQLHSAIFTDAKLKGIDIGGAKLHSANLSGAELSSADIRGAELHGANLSNFKGIGSTKGCVLYDGRFGNASTGEKKSDDTILNGADLRFARLYGANLKGAKLNGADLRFAKLHGANLKGAELYGANLRNAELYGANLEDVKLDGADLGGAKLTGSSGARISWKFVWMSDTTSFVPFFDPDTHRSTPRSEFIKKSVDRFREDTGMEDIKSDWEKGSVVKYKQLLEENIKENSWENPDMMPNDTDMMHLAHKSGYGSRSDIEVFERLRRSSIEDNAEYWKVRSEWVADFACRDEYAAEIILKRWDSETPLSNIKPKSHCMAISTIIHALKMQKERKEEECLGLHTLSDNEWQELLRPIRSRMEKLKEGYDRCEDIPNVG